MGQEEFYVPQHSIIKWCSTNKKIKASSDQWLLVHIGGWSPKLAFKLLPARNRGGSLNYLLIFLIFHMRISILNVFFPPVDNPQPRGISIDHLPKKNALGRRNNKTSRRRCFVCSSQGVRKETMYHCEGCPDKPALCLEDCFKKYHVNVL